MVTDNKDGWIQLETQDDCTFKMRGMWQISKYFNFDNHTEGSYIYSDKSDGALLKLEKFGEVSIIPVTDIPGISVYPAISNGEITVCTPGKAVIKVMNVGGYILECIWSGWKQRTFLGWLPIKLCYVDKYLLILFIN